MKQTKNRTIVNILLSALVLFVIVFFLFYGKYDLFRFPFDAGVWGTASDWAMIFVTAITAVFIYRTFQAQIEVFRLQERITKYESFNYTEKIKPIFELIITKREVEQVGNNIVVNYGFKLTNTTYPAEGVKITGILFPYLDPVMEVFWEFEDFTRHPRDPIGPIDRKLAALPFKDGNSNEPRFFLHITFSLSYEDKDGNEYGQTIEVYDNETAIKRITPGPIICKS
ncbi:hypothetical protein GCM10011386_44880 [Parapedobacter defluvii]|uniref:Uncharacterized protein n=1 Tax=Parapedobacter defluvii TaxID=2045106 RepID=A0ABQ1MZ59_9SPHI|nr:hypothetical protein [Parapedobacter defluvii]GGC47755.1 hypothetical protein GCM10011386_44880 [Parapedobacter defluvii]